MVVALRVSGQAWPAGQTVQLVARLVEKVPSVQATLPLPSALGQAQPAGQAVHADALPVAKYPDAHAVKFPLAAVVSVQAPPAGQGVQIEEFPEENVPGWHCTL